MGHARSTRPVEDEEEFDLDAEEQIEIRCVNVSPFTTRIRIGTVAGSKSRLHAVRPGQSVHLQRGYAVEFTGAGGRPVRPTIESLSEREAWPGVRDFDKDNKLVWLTRPGPRLPMIVAEDRADAVKAQWDAAMRRREEAEAAPLRLTLQRSDGVDVEVHADVAPKRAKRSAPAEDIEDQVSGQVDEPPPDHDDPLPADLGPVVEIELPELPMPEPSTVPTRAAAAARARNGGARRGSDSE